MSRSPDARRRQRPSLSISFLGRATAFPGLLEGLVRLTLLQIIRLLYYRYFTPPSSASARATLISCEIVQVCSARAAVLLTFAVFSRMIQNSSPRRECGHNISGLFQLVFSHGKVHPVQQQYATETIIRQICKTLRKICNTDSLNAKM
jgi:hypothetical protein